MPANEMVVIVNVGVDAHGLTKHFDFSQQAGVEKNPDVLVHGRQRDGRNLSADLFENPLRCGVLVGHGQGAVNDHPLMGERKPLPGTPIPKESHPTLEFPAGNPHWRILSK
jgi:hypothetical protein